MYFYLTKHTHKSGTTIIEMPSSLLVVAWECGDCTATNKGSAGGACVNCHTENPRQYEILAGSAPAATARTTYVDCAEQDNIVWSAIKNVRVAVIPRPLSNRTLVLQRLQGTLVDVVGVEKNDRGRRCYAHDVCGEQRSLGSSPTIMSSTPK